MKKTLITSTALVLLAGAAAAQVSFSGYGRFGLGYVEDRQGSVTDPVTGLPVTDDTDELALISRFRLNIDANAVTDGGVEFFGRIRLQADDNPSINEQNAAGLNGALYSVIYNGFRLDAGNVAGFFDSGLMDYYGYEPGLDGFTGQYAGVDYDFLAYSSTGSGANALFASYQVAGFQFGASYDAEYMVDGAGTALDREDRWDIGASYEFNNYKIALAYGENSFDQSLFVATFKADFDRFSGVLFLGDEDLGAGNDYEGMVYGASLSFDVGAATSILASYGSGDGDADQEEYAIGVIHDLGGGVSLRGGIGAAGPKDGDSNVIGDFGVRFNF